MHMQLHHFDFRTLSLTIIPSSIGLGNLQGTGQFPAIGTFSSPPYVRDLTNTATWITSAPNVFPVTTNNSAAPTRLGLDPAIGADLLWTITALRMWEDLVLQRGWTAEQHQEHVYRLLFDALINGAPKA